MRRRSIDVQLFDMAMPISDAETRSRGALRMRLPPRLRAITHNDSRMHKLVQRDAVWRVVTLLHIEPPDGTICTAEVFRAVVRGGESHSCHVLDGLDR
jgi:hypothetical protein